MFDPVIVSRFVDMDASANLREPYHTYVLVVLVYRIMLKSVDENCLLFTGCTIDLPAFLCDKFVCISSIAIIAFAIAWMIVCSL